MNAKQIRQAFFDFFESKGHKIVPSAAIVNHDDPTLLFTNAGMNQFKDFFLGTKEIVNLRVADTQKCLRVSGKHNDLEEVGVDSYHHTMFEMLGNWSFGDYFKKEAIDWAWELLTKIYSIDPSRIYVTVFGGDENDGIPGDKEAFQYWRKHLPENRILYFDKKDNFWEMGDTGPCGPSSEIHVDIRSEEERKKVDGSTLVNQDHPLVIEIWNLVFIQFNRILSGELKELPAKHIDTGMGFERLCMVLQGKMSNYETDIFSGYVKKLESITNKTYTNSYDKSQKADIAFRVISDHVRAVAFAIADGQLPSNSGAGYVIRRILRRAVRYYYSFLNFESPLMHQLIPMLAKDFKDVFPELEAQKEFVQKVIKEEESSFLKTLEAGLKRFDDLEPLQGILNGEDVFELYDTYGFPYDLTQLLATEKNLKIDEKSFQTALDQQRQRSRKDAKKVIGDWNILSDSKKMEFVGYDQLRVMEAKILRYREVSSKGKPNFHIVLDRTPFYAESGGQVGDTGTLVSKKDVLNVIDTYKENDLNVSVVDRLPENANVKWEAKVDENRRISITKNHSATHLLHAALKAVLGDHVVQKGSYLDDKGLRFDFSHFTKVTDEELEKIENLVNDKIATGIELVELRDIDLEVAKQAGANMLFGEKYGDKVRMITFDSKFSKELCGGCHVQNTTDIQLFKIVSESAVAAGVRRIEALTSLEALKFLNDQSKELKEIKEILKFPNQVVPKVQELLDENRKLQKKIEEQAQSNALGLRDDLLKQRIELENGIFWIGAKVQVEDGKALKSLIFELDNHENAVSFLFSEIDQKVQILGIANKALVEKSEIHIGQIVREISKEVKGGGGGQKFFASAGGSDPSGIPLALEKARAIVKSIEL